VLVAAEHDTILAVGAVTDSEEVTLNYVSPDARFRGVSRALLNRVGSQRLRSPPLVEALRVAALAHFCETSRYDVRTTMM
jgi:hypothetical protein